MPLQKILFKPGVNRENTRYTTEGGWYECDKVRFRQGNPEVIGGWEPLSLSTFLGTCRSLWNWVTLGNLNLVGVGTNLKFYIERGGAYFDVTPIRSTVTLGTDPFTGNGTTTVTVTATANGTVTGDFVTFSGSTDTLGPGGTSLFNGEYQVTAAGVNSFTITTATAVSAGSYGGSAVVATYQINTGPEFAIPFSGWGAGTWSSGAWGTGGTTTTSLRVWSQGNWGEDLVFGPRNGGIYYWDATTGVTVRGFDLATAVGASDVPTVQNYIFVSDINRFLFAFGCNDYGSAAQDPMLIRWSDQEDAYNWTPAATNQAGSLRLSHGSEIVTAIQARQEIVVFTDSALYSLQYLDAPIFWGAQLLGDNISIVGQNAAAIASGIVYWMGVDKFYAYDGRVQTLPCDLRRYVFSDFNQSQAQQVFAGTNEGFNEVWWFYCSANSNAIDKYVVYNYLERIWYYGTMGRTAWLDSGLRDFPMAATYSHTLVYHEAGLNDNVAGAESAISAYISSSEFDIGDGHNFGFVWRVLPDLTFQNSTAASPTVTMTLYGLYNSGSGSIDSAGQNVLKGSTYNITEEFTGQIYTRVRGRQMIFKINSEQLNTCWQLGAPRIDIRPDGRR
jgi:hypothetical protein